MKVLRLQEPLNKNLQNAGRSVDKSLEKSSDGFQKILRLSHGNSFFVQEVDTQKNNFACKLVDINLSIS